MDCVTHFFTGEHKVAIIYEQKNWIFSQGVLHPVGMVKDMTTSSPAEE